MPAIYLDSCLFVAAFETEEPSAEPAKRLLKRLKAQPTLAITSELTIAELLAPTKRQGVMSVAERRSLYLSILDEGGFIDLVPVTRAILLDTVVLRERLPQRLPDAIHIATAMTAGCRFFMSFDRDIRRLPLGLRWVTPTPPDVEMVLEALRA